MRREIAAKIDLLPKEYPLDNHKKQLVRNAGTGNEWSKAALHRAEAEESNFQMLFMDLYAAIGAHEEASMAIRKDKIKYRRIRAREQRAFSLPGASRYEDRNRVVLCNRNEDRNRIVLISGRCKGDIPSRKREKVEE